MAVTHGLNIQLSLTMSLSVQAGDFVCRGRSFRHRPTYACARASSLLRNYSLLA